MRHSWLLLIAGLGWACGDSSAPGFILDVNPGSVVMFRNTVSQLTARLLDAEGHPEPGFAISFESADTAIVTVGQTGLVQSRSTVGRTTIHISGGGATLNVPVNIVGIPSTLLIFPRDTAIAPMSIAQYRATLLDETGDTIPDIVFSWHSRDTTITTISTAGLATSRTTVGTTVISAQGGGLTGITNLRVATPGVPTKIDIEPADTTIPQGGTAQLRATVRDGLGNAVPGSLVTWQSDNTLVATVSSDGLVHSEGPTGFASVQASSGALSANAAVRVVDSAIVNRIVLMTGAYTVGISVANVAYVTLPDESRLARINLPAQSFDQGVFFFSTRPGEIAFNATGARAYVIQSNSTVSVISAASNSVIDAIPIGQSAADVIIEPGDSIMWVGKRDSLYAVRLATKTIIARLYHGGLANGLTIARDTLLYVSTHTSGTVLEINLRTRSLARTFTVGGVPQKLAVSADGAELYIANESGYIQFWDLDTGLQIGSNLALPSVAYGIARRPSNGLLYATSAYFGGGYLYIIDPVTRTLVHSAVVGGSLRDVAFNADGSIGIIPNEWGWVDFIK